MERYGRSNLKNKCVRLRCFQRLDTGLGKKGTFVSKFEDYTDASVNDGWDGSA